MTRKPGFEPITLGAEPVDFGVHPRQQQLSRGGRYARPLELKNLLALALHLDAHVLDFGPNTVKHSYPQVNAVHVVHALFFMASR